MPKVTTRSLYPECIANLKLPIDAFYRESRSDWIIRVTSDVDFDDYGEFGYQLEPEYTEKELRQMEEAAIAERREIENNPRQNDTNWCSCSKCI